MSRVRASSAALAVVVVAACSSGPQHPADPGPSNEGPDAGGDAASTGGDAASNGAVSATLTVDAPDGIAPRTATFHAEVACPGGPPAGGALWLEYGDAPAERLGCGANARKRLFTRAGSYTATVRMKSPAGDLVLAEASTSVRALTRAELDARLGALDAGRTAAWAVSHEGFDDWEVVYLYVDDDPVPAVADYHLTSGRSDPPRIRWGNPLFPVPKARAHVQLDYLRWKDEANAPPLP